MNILAAKLDELSALVYGLNWAITETVENYPTDEIHRVQTLFFLLQDKLTEAQQAIDEATDDHRSVVVALRDENEELREMMRDIKH